MDMMDSGKGSRVIVRCRRNAYNTPLFSWDGLGIYVRCKDCRQLDGTGQAKRGVYHLYTWATLMRMMLGIYQEEAIHADPGRNTGGNHRVDEVKEPVSERGTVGDPGRQLDGDGVQVPSV